MGWRSGHYWVRRVRSQTTDGLFCCVRLPEQEADGPRNLGLSQSIAIVDKHFKESPEEWNKPLAVTAFNALYKSCK